MTEARIQERLAWEITPELYQTIRALWIKHSKAEDARDLNGLIETLAPDCVYEIIPTGQRWEGHDGARNFYLSFLGAFPDVKFDLTDIVIGPQGVIEVTQMIGTHKGPWAGQAPTGKPVRLMVIIHFPWNPAAQKFAGERIYFDRAALAGQLGAGEEAGMRDLIRYGLETSFARVLRCVDDVSEEEASRSPHGLTPTIWQLGHLVVTDAGYLRRAGGEMEIPKSYPALFATGTGGRADYPPLAELRGRFEAVQQGLLEAAQTADLARPVEGRSYGTVGEVLTFTAYHRGYHIGKMTTLRALLGKPRLFG